MGGLKSDVYLQDKDKTVGEFFPKEKFKSTMAVFGNQLRDLRCLADLSQRELARISGISANTVYMFERGAGSPTLKVMLALSEVLGITVSDMLRCFDDFEIQNTDEKEG